MKTQNFLALSLVSLLLLSCNSDTPLAPATKQDLGVFTQFQIITASDSCQYVVYVSGSSGSAAMVHSGNCHNPIHKHE